MAHHLRGDHLLAVRDFSEAIRLDPAQARAFRFRADAYEALGEQESAGRDRTEAARLEQAGK